MTRYILSYLLVLLFVVAAPASALAMGNSKRPAAPAPTLLVPSRSATRAATTTHTHASPIASSEVAQAAKKSAALAGRQTAKAASTIKNVAKASGKALVRLARLTAYWSGEGDYYTRHHISSTGVHLHTGHCAVDPSIIPYGSVVSIDGLGSYLAVDTGTAVVSRRAARESGHNRGERAALVIDLYFENRRDGERFAANGPKFAAITWTKPGMTADVEPETTIPTLPAITDAATNTRSVAATDKPKAVAPTVATTTKVEPDTRSLAGTTKAPTRTFAATADVESHSTRLASSEDDRPRGKSLYAF
jgi:3D (Asp-Asp-Asp) domain-containing protein